MIGSIIGAGIQGISAIVGGSAQAKAARESNALLDEAAKDNEAWYKQRYNEDATQRADAQRSFQQMRDALQKRTEYATGTGVVSGATDASVAMQKNAANEAISDAISGVAVAGDARKDAIEGQYRTRKDGFTAAKRDVLSNKGKSIGDAMAGVSGAAVGIGAMYDELADKK